MLFALVRQSENKVEDGGKTLTSPRPFSTHHRINNSVIDSHDSIIHLRRTIGNQAAQRLMRSNASFGFAKIGIIQRKLKVSQPGDEYEQEADRMAEQIMRTSIPNTMFSFSASKYEEYMARKCANCKIKEEDEKMKISRKPSTTSNSEANDEILDEINSIRSGGSFRLDASTKDFMESRFGYDFSNISIHTDERVARSANALNALGYTIGNDIMFGQGQYRPSTSEGKRLLAHELTHVIQQSRDSLSIYQNRKISRENSRHGCGADNLTEQSMNGERMPVLSRLSSGIVQRAMICSKRLEAPGIGWIANHAYIDDTGRDDCMGAGMVGNYAITDLKSGNFKTGCAVKTDRSPDPRNRTPKSKPCKPKPGVSNVSRCLRDAFDSYTDPSYYNNPSGPNSNTFAGTLARTCCEDSSSSGLNWVPGWNHAPAGPCPPPKTSLVDIVPAIALTGG